MLDLSALTTMKVMVGIPCYGFLGITPITLSGLWRLASLASTAGLEVGLDVMGDSHVDRARNKLVAKFLADESYTHLFFIDADVGFSPEAFIRLLLADRDVVAGCYPLKRYEWPQDPVTLGNQEIDPKTEFEARFTPYPFATINNSLKSDEDGFAEVAETTTGFMCIKRGVFDQMRAKFPFRQYVPDWTKDDGNHWAFFDGHLDLSTKRWLSEDYAFVSLWRGMGGKVFIDLNSRLNHQGTHIWQGNLIAHLRLSGLRKG